MSKVAPPETFDSSLLLVAIVESSSDAIFATSLEGIILTWNRAATVVYGYEPKEAVGQRLTFLFSQERQAEILGILEKIGAGQLVESHLTIGMRESGQTL